MESSRIPGRMGRVLNDLLLPGEEILLEVFTDIGQAFCLTDRRLIKIAGGMNMTFNPLGSRHDSIDLERLSHMELNYAAFSGCLTNNQNIRFTLSLFGEMPYLSSWLARTQLGAGYVGDVFRLQAAFIAAKQKRLSLRPASSSSPPEPELPPPPGY